MTKTKLLGGMLGMMIALGLSTPALSAPGVVNPVSEQVYAKSAPTATVQVVKTTHEQRVARSKDAKDMMGYEKSLYQGKWYSKKWENTRKCIMHRESRFNYKSANRTSSARGAYQFLDNFWRDSLVWMMLKESKKTNDGLSKEIRSLRKKPIHEWNRYYQDRAFFTAWRHKDGMKHWYQFNSNCM
jgi:muramidase (phage lysozyme)